MLVGANDLGTGADTVLGQIAAEVLGVPLSDIQVYHQIQTTPFDTGASHPAQPTFRELQQSLPLKVEKELKSAKKC